MNMILQKIKQIIYTWLPRLGAQMQARQNPISEVQLHYVQAQYYEKLALEHSQIFERLHANHPTSENDPATQDKRNAMWNFLSAALKGHCDSQYKLGLCYLNGDLGLDKNYTHAQEWLEKAAKQGHPEAKKTLLYSYSQIAF
ncbi:MAG: sel1 repeat family protein [Acinetobacter sp.]|nr:MAG: sel1 repeat family protein [Acinetobacter sp.]